ncbi:carbohydrate ABC transporter permease [Actinoalloteichus hymeniacidonis]|uniref:Permease component of ABC-type sugar transporter n=1 Tax=Actinoalloteichus hymeniacidonis TaxID=340345 RepID=A0AAC9HQD4_9PSEU|nr:sugar ABC transporter permease [Actinoalloteichus hymeniacidonis]AOS63505.1 permease component of ABC-type sugar transporter [Actinoalloteichus hymeniacidonis]MBB5908451.1 multiple sugar transport system permease protein [Actinoalloteichus hymeniacidonis]
MTRPTATSDATDEPGTATSLHTARPGSHRRRRRGHLAATRRTEGLLLAAPALVFLAALLLFPLLYNLVTSFLDVDLAGLLGEGTPFVGGENYRAAVSESDFWAAVGLTLVFTVGSLVLQFGIGFALALLFARDFPFNGLLRSLMLVAWLLPPVVSGSLFRWMLDGDVGAYNAILRSLGLDALTNTWLTDTGTALGGVIFANVWIGVPFNMILLLVGLVSLDRDLYASAALDGASAWQRFRFVTLPLMRPVSAAVLLLGLIYTFKAFDIVFVMTGGGPVDATRVLPLLAYEQFFEFFRFGEGAAITVLLLVIPLVVSIWYVRRIGKEGDR